VLRFFFRKPKFPVLCDVQGLLISARTPRELSEAISSIQLPAGEHLPFIDASSEGWVLVVDFMGQSEFPKRFLTVSGELLPLFIDMV